MIEARHRALVLARYLSLAWCALILYASLHPFSGWRTTGASPLAFLNAGWPRYWTAFDLATNVAIYLPFGFFLTLAFDRLPGRALPALLALLCGGALSFAMECLQTWLPSRVPSNLDLACNLVGSLAGAGFALVLRERVMARLARLDRYLNAPVGPAELTLTLLGLWLLVPLSPETLLFGAGDWRQILDFEGSVPFVAESFVLVEAGVVVFNALAVGLLVRYLCASLAQAYLFAPLFLLLGLAVRTLGAIVLVGPDEAFAWLTPGVRLGLPLAGLLLILVMPLPAAARYILTALALVMGVILVNLAPANPYSQAALAAWQQGSFLNFNGLTRVVAGLWPFLTLFFLWPRRGRP